MNARRAACTRRRQRIKPRALNEYICRFGRHRRRGTAHHAAKADHAACIGNYAHVRRHGVGLAVQRIERFAILAAPRHDRAAQLGGIIDVQRPCLIQRDIIGHVHQQ